jgi:hypothetical protein
LSTALLSQRTVRSNSELPTVLPETLRLRNAAEEQLHLHRRVQVAEEDIHTLTLTTEQCRVRYQTLAKRLGHLEPTHKVNI